jgi:putative phosphoribosyl transferase
MLFKDRRDAGRQLAAALQTLSLKEGLIIGLPRGGVVVAAEVARLLSFPLDVIIPRKIGAPFNSELAIGALVDDVVLLNDELIQSYGIDPSYVQAEIRKEKKEAMRRLVLYRQGKAPQNFKNKTVILIDDGIATGATMRASYLFIKSQKPKRIIIAVPVAPPDTVQRFKKEGAEIIALYTPMSFMAVGQFYDEFPQTEDAEVIELLK